MTIYTVYSMQSIITHLMHTHLIAATGLFTALNLRGVQDLVLSLFKIILQLHMMLQGAVALQQGSAAAVLGTARRLPK